MSLIKGVHRFLPTLRLGCRFYYDAIVRERQPSKIHHGVFEGERVIPDPPQTLTDVEESKEEFKYVEKLLGSKVVPEPPEHDHYPTPSGWIPQRTEPGDLPYFIKRTRFHNLPIYIEILNGGNRKMTVIRYVQGDIWALEGELSKFISEKSGKKTYTQVDEVCRKIRVRGDFIAEVTEFCISKGL